MLVLLLIVLPGTYSPDGQRLDLFQESLALRKVGESRARVQEEEIDVGRSGELYLAKTKNDAIIDGACSEQTSW